MKAVTANRDTLFAKEGTLSMKRDMDLMRQIMMEVENLRYDGGGHEITIPDHAKPEIYYHVLLLHEAGLIEALDLSGNDYVLWRPTRLTYAGHEFLDAARDETRWNKAKDKVTSTTGTLTIEALKITLSALIKHALTGGM
jgi:hypothetical protein